MSHHRMNINRIALGRIPRAAAVTILLAGVTLLAGCVEPPPPRPYRAVREVPAPPPPNTDVYAYPLQNQTPEQQDRDRYDCHLWAVKQTGFDPSAPNVPPHDRVRLVTAAPAPAPGAQTAFGAVAGAILGAAISRPRDAGFGAVAGAIAGGAIGNASEQAQAAQNQAAVNADVRQASAQQNAAMEQKASSYRRAIGACLDARGYSVK
ncbi:MAG TPA: glycine zipper 2TM domain-containing protein [Steroidobacteraceae bacterium]